MSQTPTSAGSQAIPIQDYVLRLQMEAIDKRASDVFLASQSKPSCRIDGKTLFFEDEPILTSEMLEAYLEGMMSEYDHQILKEKLEHDFSITIEGGHRFRVNAFYQKNGLSITFRVIPNIIPSFEELGLPDHLYRLVNLPSGLVLVTGSAGSGKSSTLASVLDLINQKHNKHILTIEDPIEYIHKDKSSLVEQRAVGPHSRSFGQALRSSLRQAPDVIMVGELRDLETIALAITAAETGSLVFATLHTNDAAGAVNRLIDIFPGNEQNQVRSQLAQSLQAVVWQKLLPRKGGMGRVAAFEIMFRTNAVAHLIRDQKTYQLKSVIQTGQNDGMLPLKNMLNFLVEKEYLDIEIAKKTLEDHG